jgi:hypothetical protein
MAVAVNDIVDDAELILQDTTNARWTVLELVSWLNDGQRDIVREKPEAGAINASVALVAGTKQTIPAAGILLIDVVRNMGTDGSTPGWVITVINRKVLDAQIPDWHLTSNAAVVTRHYMFDPRDPRNWYVYPPSDATTQVEIIYSAVPAIVAAGASIGIDDVYRSIILDYVLYRAYSKDADFAPNIQRASGHLGAYMNALGLQERAETLVSPNQQLVQQVAA